MARIRRFCAYRRIERPHTRRSKYSKKNFVKGNPQLKIVRFDMGNLKREFKYAVSLMPKKDIQIRHEAIESARQTCNRLLEKDIGKNDFYAKIRVYPHHVLRENPLAAGAGADRMSTGMKKAFGKSIGLAAQIREGQVIIHVGVNKPHLETAKKALKRFSYKLPCACSIDVIEK